MSTQGIRAGRAYVEIGTHLDPLNKGLRSAQAQLQSMASYSRGLGASLIGTATAMAAAVFKPLADAAALEQTMANFETMLGSAGAAKKMVDDIYRMAAETPFETTGLNAVAETLLQFDVAANEVLPLMKMLGDASGGNAQRFASLALVYGQVSANGKLMGQDMLQMVNAGFNPLLEIANRTGETMGQVFERMEAGKISVDEVKQSLIDATGPGGRFYGLMARQSQTLIGRLSTLADTLTTTLRPIGEALMPTAKAVSELGANLLSSSGIITKFVGENRVMLAGFVSTIAVLAVSGAALLGFSAGLALLKFTVAPLIGFLALLKAGLLLLGSPVVLLVAAIAMLAYQLVDWQTVSAEVFAWIEKNFGDLAKGAHEMIDAIGAALQRGDIAAAAKILWLGLKVAWTTGANALLGFWNDIKYGALSAFVDIQSSALTMWANVKAAGKTLWADWSAMIKGGVEKGIAEAEKLDLKIRGRRAKNIMRNEYPGKSEEYYESLAKQIDEEIQNGLDAIDRRTNAVTGAINDEAQAEKDNAEQQRKSSLSAMDRDRAATQANIESAHKGELAKLDAELDAAKKSYTDLMAEQKRKREENIQSETEGQKKSARDGTAKATATMNGFSGGGGDGREAIGTFSAFGIWGLGANSAANRTANATEQTAKILVEMQREGGAGAAFGA